MSKRPNNNKKPKLLNRKNYIPFYLINIANQYSRGASRIYLRLFGIGVIEWRMLSVISIEKVVTANQICAAIHLDKGAASRSLKTLVSRDLVNIYADAQDSRKRLVSLTQKGIALHDEIIKIALAREKHLTANFTAEEHDMAVKLLKKMNENLTHIDDFDYRSLINMDYVEELCK